MFSKIKQLVQLFFSPFGDKQREMFSMEVNGRIGFIRFSSGSKVLDIDWEMSGVDSIHLLAPLRISEWKEPKGLKLSLDEQLEVLHKLRQWLKTKKFVTNIDAPLIDELDAEVCLYGCGEKRIKGSAYCPKHYDQTLLNLSKVGNNQFTLLGPYKPKQLQ